jgi:hypothetical protein
LHQHPTHAETRPVGLEETRLGGITASKTRGRGDANLEFSPKRREWWSPHNNRNRLAMVLAFNEAQRLDSDFEEGAMDVAEGEETDEGGQRRTSARDRPVVDQIELGLSRAIAIRSNVVANMLNAVGEKLAFLQLKSDTMLQKDVADTFK